MDLSQVNWLREVQGDQGKIVPAIDYYESELIPARAEVSLKGSLEKHSRDMPGIVELRFRQLQEIESILEYLNIEMRKIRSIAYRKYNENYNRVLTSRDIEKYVDGESSVVDMQHIINEFALLRNKYIAITKALDNKQWQITNITKLRVVGLDDVSI